MGKVTHLRIHQLATVNIVALQSHQHLNVRKLKMKFRDMLLNWKRHMVATKWARMLTTKNHESFDDPPLTYHPLVESSQRRRPHLLRQSLEQLLCLQVLLALQIFHRIYSLSVVIAPSSPKHLLLQFHQLLWGFHLAKSLSSGWKIPWITWATGIIGAEYTYLARIYWTKTTCSQFSSQTHLLRHLNYVQETLHTVMYNDNNVCTMSCKSDYWLFNFECLVHCMSNPTVTVFWGIIILWQNTEYITLSKFNCTSWNS